MKIIFFGSDDFAVVNLDALLRAGHAICACVTAPDRPKGRGMHLAVSPIKEFAQSQEIPVLQPTDLHDERFIQQLKDCSADLFVVIAYGKFLPPELLAIPKICAVNSHGSLLPKYRGAAPINWAIINGEKETGVTIIKLNAGMDAGDTIIQEKVSISDHQTAVTLRARLAQVSAECLCRTVPALEKGRYRLTAQRKEDVTFAPKLKKEMGLIDWNKSASEIQNLVRGLLPWPTAYTFLNKKMIKVIDGEVVARDSVFRPGEIAGISAQGFVVACGQDGLLVKKVHPESGKPMLSPDFVHGHKVAVGLKFDARH